MFKIVVFLFSLPLVATAASNKDLSSVAFQSEIAAAMLKGYNKFSGIGQMLKNIEPKNESDKKFIAYWSDKIGNHKLAKASVKQNVVTFKSDNDSMEFEIVNYLNGEYKINGFPYKISHRTKLVDFYAFLEKVSLSKKKTAAHSAFNLIFSEAQANTISDLLLSVIGWNMPKEAKDTLRLNVKEIDDITNISSELLKPPFGGFSKNGVQDIVVKEFSCSTKKMVVYARNTDGTLARLLYQGKYNDLDESHVGAPRNTRKAIEKCCDSNKKACESHVLAIYNEDESNRAEAKKKMEDARSASGKK